MVPLTLYLRHVEWFIKFIRITYFASFHYSSSNVFTAPGRGYLCMLVYPAHFINRNAIHGSLSLKEPIANGSFTTWTLIARKRMTEPANTVRRTAARDGYAGRVRNRFDTPRGRNYIVIMKATLVRIGNSRGIRLPKPVIEQCGFEDEVEMEVHHHELVIRSSSRPREGWAGAFARMRKCGDDELLDRVAETGTTWADGEWEW